MNSKERLSLTYMTNTYRVFGLPWVVRVQCDCGVAASVGGMTQSVSIVLKFPMYNITNVAPE